MSRSATGYGDKMKFIVVVFCLLLLATPALADLMVNANYKSDNGQLTNYVDIGGVKERSGGIGNVSYSLYSEQTDSDSSQAYQSSFSLDSPSASFPNRYFISINSKTVGLQERVASHGDKYVGSESTIMLTPESFKTDLSTSGMGSTDIDLIGAKTTAIANGENEILTKTHPISLIDLAGSGNFTSNLVISATPTPIIVPNVGSYLGSSTASTTINPSGEVVQPSIDAAAPPDIKKDDGKMTASGLMAYRVSTHPELKHYLADDSIPWETCPETGEKFKTVTDPVLGEIQVYNL